MNTIGKHNVSAFTPTTAQKVSLANNLQPKNIVNINKGSSNISINEQATKTIQGEAINRKYTETINAVVNQQASSSPSAETGQTISLDTAALKMFNAADVKDYEKLMMSELSARGVDTSYPMKLEFDYQGNVIVNNDHPDKEVIETTFKENRDLRNGLVQSSNYYLFQEIAALHQQWADKINSGVSEKIANTWLINTVGSATAKSAQGITFENGSFQDPFASNKTASTAIKTYQL